MGIDRALLGLEVGDDGRWAFEVVPRLCRTDGRFYGGAAVAAALTAAELATGRPSLWSTTQLVAAADLGERIDVAVEVVASGRSIDQVQVRGTAGDRLVFAASGSTATPRAEGMSGRGRAMPAVPAPGECTTWLGPGDLKAGVVEDTLPVGHHLVTESRAAPLLDEDPTRPGRFALWSRLRWDVLGVDPPPAMTAATLAFLADLVPVAIARACGVVGAGTSLDNSLRVGEPSDGVEWVLVEVDAHVAVGGYGHGEVDLWSEDGRLLATGTQSARLFDLAGFMPRRAPGTGGRPAGTG